MWVTESALLGLVCVASVLADGSLPALPYHYLHPPPALAGSNTPPVSGDADLFLSGGKFSGDGFTGDGQAGITVDAGTLAAPSSVTDVHIRIQPVDTPPGLPPQVVVDGNAYRFVAQGQPGNTPVRLVKTVTITLRWPHFPLAIYLYRNGKWTQLCDSNHAVFTTSTIACPALALGTFAVVTTPINAGTGAPTTPASGSRFAWINRYIPVIAAGLVFLAAIAVAYFVSRPEKASKK
jgi:hypothetical protein